MTKERLVEITNLILQCDRWGTHHRVHLKIDNSGEHEIYIYPHVGNGGGSATYFAKMIIPCIEEVGEDFGYYYDPEFKQAEAHIKKLLEEIKMP